MPCTQQKSKWAAARTIQLAQKLAKIEKHIKTERFPSRVLWREMKGIWEK
jgi:hypothetical protein